MSKFGLAGWRAWYADGQAYTSADLAWQDLPSKGMVGVVLYLDPPYRQLIQTCDWWWMDEDGVIRGVPTHPEWGKWAEKPDAPPEMVKRGAGLADDVWEAVQVEMMEAREWP